MSEAQRSVRVTFWAEVNATLADELLQRTGQAPLAFFEDLALERLRDIGYTGTEDDVQRVGRETGKSTGTSPTTNSAWKKPTPGNALARECRSTGNSCVAAPGHISPWGA